MSISSTSSQRERAASTTEERAAAFAPVTLSERSLTGLALLRVLVGYLWFQQLFWKLPPTFAGLYGYVVREAQHTFIPGYGAVLQHTFLLGCPSLSGPTGCTLFVPLAAGVWTGELLVSISLMFGLFSRFGAILASMLALQLYVGLSTTEWYWTYGTIVLLGLFLTTIPAGRRFGVDQWLHPRLQAAAQRSRVAAVLSWLS